jgi:hypothetical protein
MRLGDERPARILKIGSDVYVFCEMPDCNGCLGHLNFKYMSQCSVLVLPGYVKQQETGIWVLSAAAARQWHAERREGRNWRQFVQDGQFARRRWVTKTKSPRYRQDAQVPYAVAGWKPRSIDSSFPVRFRCPVCRHPRVTTLLQPPLEYRDGQAAATS